MDIEMSWTITVYLSTFIFSSFFAFGVATSKNKDSAYACRILLFLAMLIPAALRYDLGADYSSYMELYETGKYIGYSEPGFNFICNFLKQFNLDSFWMFLTISIITYFILAFKIGRKRIFTFIVFYFLYTGYFRSLDQIRQSVALPFIILGMEKFVNKKYMHFIIYIIIAALFHSSSYIFLLLVPISEIPIKRNLYFLIIPLTVFIILKINIQESLFKLIGIFMPKYMRFADSQNAEFGTGIGVLIKIFFPISYIVFCNRKHESIYAERESRISKNFCMIYIFLQFLTLRIEIFNRLRDVVWNGVLFAIPSARKNMKYYNVVKLIVFVIGVVLFIHDINYNSVRGTTEISPYRTIFEK